MDRNDPARQSLARDLTADEVGLAGALEKIFASGAHGFADVVARLNQDRVRRPSGANGAWTVEALHEEIAAINASLDAAYEGRG